MIRSLVSFVAVTIATIAVACGAASDDADPTETAQSQPSVEVGPTATLVEQDAQEPEATVPLLREGGFVPLDNPDVVSAAEAEADYMEPEHRVLGIEVNGESRAYPVNMMTYHHVVNDVVGGEPVLVTF